MFSGHDDLAFLKDCKKFVRSERTGFEGFTIASSANNTAGVIKLGDGRVCDVSFSAGKSSALNGG